MIASTQGDRDLALEHLGKAETAAGWIGQDRNDYHTEFGPTNVALCTASPCRSSWATPRRRKAADIDTLPHHRNDAPASSSTFARAHAQRRRAPGAVRASGAETYAQSRFAAITTSRHGAGLLRESDGRTRAAEACAASRSPAVTRISCTTRTESAGCWPCPLYLRSTSGGGKEATMRTGARFADATTDLPALADMDRARELLG